MFPNQIKILIVDDMMTMRKLIAKTLKQMGFTDLTEATDGGKAWEAMNSANPPFQLVLSDWNMPVSTGIDLLKRARADGRYKTVPFILITAESEKGQVAEALSAGVTEYIVKPFDQEMVTKKLQSAYQKINASAP